MIRKFWWVDWCQTLAYVELWTIFIFESITVPKGGWCQIDRSVCFWIDSDIHLEIVVISVVATTSAKASWARSNLNHFQRWWWHQIGFLFLFSIIKYFSISNKSFKRKSWISCNWKFRVQINLFFSTAFQFQNKWQYAHKNKWLNTLTSLNDCAIYFSICLNIYLQFTLKKREEKKKANLSSIMNRLTFWFNTFAFGQFYTSLLLFANERI